MYIQYEQPICMGIYKLELQARACKAHTDQLLIISVHHLVSLAIELETSQTLFTVTISIVFASLIIHEFDNVK
jgi:hypothetical protein